MAACKLPFTLVCFIVIVVEICALALQIVSSSTSAWVGVKASGITYWFGVFNLKAKASTSVQMISHSALVTLQAMLIFSIGFGITAVIAIMIGITKKPMCNRGTSFYVKLAEICLTLSALAYIIGIATFTHFWLKEPQKFFRPTLAGASYFYGYAYVLGWLAFFIQSGLAMFLIVSINCVIRKQDRKLAEDTDTDNETKKLVGSEHLPATKEKLQDEPSTSKVSKDDDVATTSKDSSEGIDHSSKISAEAEKSLPPPEGTNKTTESGGAVVLSQS